MNPWAGKSIDQLFQLGLVRRQDGKSHRDLAYARRRINEIKYYKKNKTKMNQRSIEWCKAHPDKAKAAQAKYRAKKNMTTYARDWYRKNKAKLKAKRQALTSKLGTQDTDRVGVVPTQ